MATHHKLDIERTSLAYIPVCSCGWRGMEQITEQDATACGDTHHTMEALRLFMLDY